MLEAGKLPDMTAIEVITYHAAIEREIELVLRKVLPHPDAILKGSPSLNFAQKAKLLIATWQGKDENADKLAKVLHALQNLRNAVAHSDGHDEIKACNTNLSIAFREIAGRQDDDYPIHEVAQGICLFMADGSTIEQWENTFDALHELVNVKLPAALGAKGKEQRS
jgi:hypothetical protein